MPRSEGRPPKPIEVKRRLGNPGKRPLPEQSTTVSLLPGGAEPPTPARPLGEAGSALWQRVWRAGAIWLARTSDSEAVLILCEQVDERQSLRLDVLRSKDWRARAALRALDSQILNGLASLGFTPTDRARLGVGEVKPQSGLDAILADEA